MRKVTRSAVSAFLARRSFSGKNTRTDGETLYLHGNPIARHIDGRVEVRLAGWNTTTTRERVNGVLSALNAPWRFCQHRHEACVYMFGIRKPAPVCVYSWHIVAE